MSRKKRRKMAVEPACPPWEFSDAELREFTGADAERADRGRLDREAAWEWFCQQADEQPDR